MSTPTQKPQNDPAAVATQKLEDLPAEVETLSVEEAEQVAGGATFVVRLDLAGTDPKPASGALKTIAAAQTD